MKRRSPRTIAAVAALAAIFSATGLAYAADLKVGDECPDVTLTLDDGSALKLREVGKPIVLWFYPKDDTPG